MDKNRFDIVFEKVAEAKTEDSEISRVELESKEIAELRRIVLEITVPEPKFFTGT